MNIRLIWNFEVNNVSPLDMRDEEDIVPNEVRWESRFFWPANDIILLPGLPDEGLKLSNYKFKEKQDSYYVLPDLDYNLKLRRGKLLYKPLLTKTEGALAYGKKINLEEQLGLPLPGHKIMGTIELLDHIKKQGQKITVAKESVTYAFPLPHPLKLELARLQVFNTFYFSVSVESRQRTSVEALSQHLFGNKVTCDYVTFLKSIMIKLKS